MDSADELASAIAKAILDAAPRDGSGQKRLDASVMLTALGMVAGDVVASAPAEVEDGVCRQLDAAVRDYASRNRGKSTWLTGRVSIAQIGRA